MYERPRVNVKDERGSTFTFTRDPPYIVSILFKLRDSGNPPYERSRVNVKVEPRSTFTFARGLSYIASISFTRVNFTCVRTEKLRSSGINPETG